MFGKVVCGVLATDVLLALSLDTYCRRQVHVLTLTNVDAGNGDPKFSWHFVSWLVLIIKSASQLSVELLLHQTLRVIENQGKYIAPSFSVIFIFISLSPSDPNSSFISFQKCISLFLYLSLQLS